MRVMCEFFRKFSGLRLICLALMVIFNSPAAVLADESADARNLVENAQMSMENFLTAPEMDAFRQLLKKANGVFIAPQVLKGAFIIGASGGSGVMLARDQAGKWHGPAFYTIGEVSYGLQAGGKASEVILLAMTERGVTAFLENSIKLGAGVGVAAGPIGAGASAATANLSADIISFSRSKGLFGGIALDGAVVATRDGLNEAYYARKVNSTEILIQHKVDSPQAAALIEVVSKGSAVARK